MGYEAGLSLEQGYECTIEMIERERVEEEERSRGG